MKRFKIEKSCPLRALAFVVLGLVSVGAVIFLTLSKMLSKAQEDEKWSEYDDCGIF